MATFVLIHGAWQAGWCWNSVAPSLRELGHVVMTPDLPGHGADAAPPETVTLSDYVNALVGCLEETREPAILVGHSFAAGYAMQTAEAVPERVAGLVYIAGVLPASGKALMDGLQGVDPDYLAQIAWSSDRTVAMLRPEGARAFLYPLSAPSLVDEALRLFTAEPVAPCLTPLCLTAERYGQVRAYYVECLRDRIVAPSLQRQMYESAGVRRVFPIDSDHSPFLSKPTELVACLHAVSQDLSATHI